jgi:hypothetical protein
MMIGAENRDDLQQAFSKRCTWAKENSFEIRNAKEMQMIF